MGLFDILGNVKNVAEDTMYQIYDNSEEFRSHMADKSDERVFNSLTHGCPAERIAAARELQERKKSKND